MALRVYTGMPGTGKSSALIREMRNQSVAGKHVALFLSNEDEELTRRHNVKPGGLMGCREPGLNYEIDYVVDTYDAMEILSRLIAGTLAVFDEAQFFRSDIVEAWALASKREVDVLVASPSEHQLLMLREIVHERVHLEVLCECDERNATRFSYQHDNVYPIHLCELCYGNRMKQEIEQLLSDVREAEPFPGENHTYQPFFDIPMEGWALVREDSSARFAIVMNAVERSRNIRRLMNDSVQRPSFVDFGCCSGFFCDAMDSLGFRSTGVDVGQDFINWGDRLAKIKGKSINYLKKDLFEYLITTDAQFDVVSTFATIQWVMDQRGYDAGITCIENIFSRTREVCIFEIGYTDEEIYQSKIKDRPEEINREWVLKIMERKGGFECIEIYPAGEGGIWRDIFIGFKQKPERKAVKYSARNLYRKVRQVLKPLAKLIPWVSST